MVQIMKLHRKGIRYHVMPVLSQSECYNRCWTNHIEPEDRKRPKKGLYGPWCNKIRGYAFASLRDNVHYHERNRHEQHVAASK
jgi:hypothetical protein